MTDRFEDRVYGQPVWWWRGDRSELPDFRAHRAQGCVANRRGFACYGWRQHERSALTEQQMAIWGLTDVGGIRQNNLEDWLELARRGADNFQHFGGRVLALARVIKLTGELVNFVLHVSR